MGKAAPTGVAASGAPAQGDRANAVISGRISAVGPQAPFAFRGPMNVALWADVNTTLTTTAGSLAATVSSATGLAAGCAINSADVPPGTTIGALSGTNVTLAVPPVTLPCIVSKAAPICLVSAANSDFDASTLVGATVTSADQYTTIPAGTTVLSAAGQTVVLSQTPTAVSAFNAAVSLVFARNGNAIVTTGADANALFTGAAVSFNAALQLERSFDGGSTFIVGNIGANGALAQWTGATVTPVQFTFGEPEIEVLYRLNTTAYSSGRINYRISQTGGAAESLAVGPLSGG